MSKKIRVGIYARVSTHEQTVENQLMALNEVCERHPNWEIRKTFLDEGISGAKGREKRPGFNDLCKAVSRHNIDLVVVWSVDRLGRSLQDLVGFMVDLHANNVDLYLEQQGIDTSTPSGRAMFQMMGVFAEFERAMIQDRVKAGMARARAQGKLIGRPKVSEELEQAILAARDQGKGIRRIARELGCGTSTVQRMVSSNP